MSMRFVLLSQASYPQGHIHNIALFHILHRQDIRPIQSQVYTI